MYELKSNCYGRTQFLFNTGKSFVKGSLSTKEAELIIKAGKLVESNNADYPICVDNKWYFKGTVTETNKKYSKKEVVENENT